MILHSTKTTTLSMHHMALHHFYVIAHVLSSFGFISDQVFTCLYCPFQSDQNIIVIEVFT